MKQLIPWTSILARVALATCVVAFAATATAESPNEIEMQKGWTPSTIMPADDDLVTEGFTSPLTVMPSDFRPDGWALDHHYFLFSGGHLYGVETGCYMAPVYLPNGAEVTQMNVNVMDNHATTRITVQLRRVGNYSYTAGTSIMAAASTSSQSASIVNISDLAIIDPIVSYPNYSYYMTVCLYGTSEHRLYGARIYWD